MMVNGFLEQQWNFVEGTCWSTLHR